MTTDSYYCNFNLYRGKKRVAIFGEKIDSNQLQIIIIPCSRDDQFSKKKARKIYADIMAGRCKEEDDCPYKFDREILNFTEKPKRTFIEWCFRNFKSRVCIGYKVLFEGDDDKHIPLYQVVKPEVAEEFKRREVAVE